MSVDIDELIEQILSTADDLKLSKGEKKSLSMVIEEAALSSEEQLRIRGELFTAVASKMKHPEDRKWIVWLEDAVKLLDISGISYNPFTRKARIDKNVSANYIVHARKS